MSATPEVLAEYDATLEERDLIEEMVANGELCAADGGDCEWETIRYEYGADLDGNRGEWREYDRCRKCHEER